MVQSSTFVQPGGLERRGALHPVRQQPEPGRPRAQVRAPGGGGGGGVPVQRDGRHRAGPPRGAASRRPPRSPASGSTAAPAGSSTTSSAASASRSPTSTRRSIACGESRCASRPAPSSSRRRPIPTLRVIDLAPIAQVTKEFGLALLVDAHLREPDQPAAHRARSRRRHQQRDEVPERPQRRDRRGGGGHGLIHRRGHPADAALGAVDRPACRLAGGARAQDAGRPDGPAQRQRHGGRRVGRGAARVRGGALPRAARPPRPRLRQGSAARLRRHGRARSSRAASAPRSASSRS